MISRPRLRVPRGRKAVLAALAAALVVAVPIAWASHDFTDVPTGHPFHDDIAAVKDAGITAGKTCVPPGTPPTYCPSENITREAMAAFVRRGVGRIDMDSTVNAPDIPISGSAFTTLLTESMVVGGVGQSLHHDETGAEPARHVHPHVRDERHRHAVARADDVHLVLHRARVGVDEDLDQAADPGGACTAALTRRAPAA